MAVTSLEDTVRSLEQKCTDAEENNINLKKEVEELRELEKANARKGNESCHKSTQTTADSSHRGNDFAIGNDGKKTDIILFYSAIHPLSEATSHVNHAFTLLLFSI